MTPDFFSRVEVGQRVRREYHVSEAVYRGFLETFGDRNALHVEEAYAKSKGYSGKVMHGAILAGFISEFVGVEFPGHDSLLQSLRLDFKRPNYLGDHLILEATVEQKVEAVRVLVLKIDIRNSTQGAVCAQARVQVGLL